MYVLNPPHGCYNWFKFELEVHMSKFLIACLASTLFSVTAFAQTEKVQASDLLSQISACKKHFSGKIDRRAKLDIVCTDPNTAGSRTEFIAIQFTEPGGGQPTIICYETANGAAVLEQNNYLFAGTAVLNIVGQNPVESFARDKVSPGVAASLRDARCMGESLSD